MSFDMIIKNFRINLKDIKMMILNLNLINFASKEAREARNMQKSH